MVEKESKKQSLVVGVGAPIIDYIIQIADEYLQRLPGAKAGMVPVDHETFTWIIEKAGEPPILRVGGSCANAIRGLAHLGVDCAFVGKVGRDDSGDMFLKEIDSLDISKKYIFTSSTPTSRVACLVTPDKERTMRSFLGASKELSADDMTSHMFEGVKLVHLEGYNLLNLPLAQKTMELAKAAGAKISFDLGSFEMVQANKALLIDTMSRYIDVLFGNEDEIYCLTQLFPEKSCEILRDLVGTVVVLMGEKGCIVGHGDKQSHFPAMPIETLVDTTGAGDLFASGFLYGYLHGATMEHSALLGSLAGAAVVQVPGVELPPQKWEQIKKLKDKI